VVGNVHPPPLFYLLIDAKCITHKMPCVLKLFFPLFTPHLCVGIFHSYFSILNVVSYNMCVHTRAIIFILTSNSSDPTLKFQQPIWAIIFILTSNSNDPTPKFHQLLNHYVFRHRLVYPIYLILFGIFFENYGCIFDFF